MALKFTRIYFVLPEEVQELLGSCRYQVKKETLKGLARLSKESRFSKAADGVWAAVSYGANDVNSVLTAFKRHHGSGSFGASGRCSEIPPVKLDSNNYDHEFLKRAKLLKAEIAKCFRRLRLLEH